MHHVVTVGHSSYQSLHVLRQHGALSVPGAAANPSRHFLAEGKSRLRKIRLRETIPTQITNVIFLIALISFRYIVSTLIPFLSSRCSDDVAAVSVTRRRSCRRNSIYTSAAGERYFSFQLLPKNSRYSFAARIIYSEEKRKTKKERRDGRFFLSPSQRTTPRPPGFSAPPFLFLSFRLHRR